MKQILVVVALAAIVCGVVLACYSGSEGHAFIETMKTTDGYLPSEEYQKVVVLNEAHNHLVASEISVVMALIFFCGGTLLLHYASNAKEGIAT